MYTDSTESPAAQGRPVAKVLGGKSLWGGLSPGGKCPDGGGGGGGVEGGFREREDKLWEANVLGGKSPTGANFPGELPHKNMRISHVDYVTSI